ncbi:MAG: PD-(D/E)XK nuclease family protein, partial [Actinomycetota bacterium]|nr:PD-(D/E)XK nuclease family protein [Actinomycetota bacterium]
FWLELAELEEPGLVECVERAETPEVNPMFGAMEDRRRWPPVPRIGEDDALFPEGWGTVADAVVAGETSVDRWIAALPEEARSDAAGLVDAFEHELQVIAAAAEARPAAEPSLPDIISATTQVRLDAGDIDAWDVIRPLPERPSRARRLGTEIHRLIEERSRGMSAYPDEGELDEPGEVTDPGLMSRLLSNWGGSGYADRELAVLPSGEPMVELPFTMVRNGRIVRGRIDVVYETPDGGLEIVDVKTGVRFDPHEGDQLDLYAEALDANGLIPEGKELRLTYVFLDGGPPVTRMWSRTAA